MISFEERVETPISVEFDGKTYQLQRVVIRDYLPWIADLAKEYQERNLALMPAGLKLPDQAQYKSAIMGRKFTPEDVKWRVGTQEGVDRVILLSFKRSGVDDEDLVKRYIDSLDWETQLLLAMKLSRLFSEEVFRDMVNSNRPKKKDGDSKNSEAGETPAESQTQIGS